MRNNPTQLLVEKSIISGFSSRIMQAQKEVLAKIVFFTLLIKSFPLLLPSHNCINNSQCSVFKVHL